jgi:hypothetical protein
MRSITGDLPAALRRLAAGLALATTLCFASGLAEARLATSPAGARQSGGISIDISPLLASGLDGYAQVIRVDLQSALAAEFAGRLAPGSRLLVQVRSVSLTSTVSDRISPFGNNDYLDGVVTLIGPDGRELATQKILAVSSASSGAPWYIAGAEQRRTAALSAAFASWARRYMPV